MMISEREAHETCHDAKGKESTAAVSEECEVPMMPPSPKLCWVQ